MGNCCCRTESPCGSAEETSGLLKDDSKATAPAGETLVGGSCSPEGDDNIKVMLDEETIKPKEAVKVKKSAVVVEKEPNNTQENGAFQKEVIQKASPSPRKGSELKENSTAVKDEVIKDSPADSGQAEPMQCTLISPQREQPQRNGQQMWHQKKKIQPQRTTKSLTAAQ
ncbi:Histone-lysine N-methyltransferase H3 lysine-4 specific [Dissostichus eleginoides]|uniref:Histone-lysine N-methyltransferase H3 lysine-4 specific n=1 Tax=Dissostichus eleginoides TaxID=100907 RepID=A0AAD9BLR0_DISEL|nr:Histone-lysine N-methyltransferase H3 lysine-4 specific [Dissostichus eleginoides]